MHQFFELYDYKAWPSSERAGLSMSNFFFLELLPPLSTSHLEYISSYFILLNLQFARCECLIIDDTPLNSKGARACLFVHGARAIDVGCTFKRHNN